MRLRLLVPLLLLFGIPLAGQEHAPTAAQCQADADAWGVPNPPPLLFLFHLDDFSKMDVSSVTAKALGARIAQLEQCVKTDSANSNRYNVAGLFYRIAIEDRITKFAARHNLMSQFYDEDKQGKR
jgi:hypothetical protein